MSRGARENLRPVTQGPVKDVLPAVRQVRDQRKGDQA